MGYQPLRWVGNENGTPAHIETYPEGSSETFAKGDIVIYDRSENGIVAIPATSGEPDAVLMTGIVLQAASTTAATARDVLIPNTSDIFSAILCSAVDTVVAPDEDNIGQLYSLVKNTSTLDLTTAVLEGGSGDWLKVQYLDKQDLARAGVNPYGANITGSSGDRVYFKFLAAAVDSAGTQA